MAAMGCFGIPWAVFHIRFDKHPNKPLRLRHVHRGYSCGRNVVAVSGVSGARFPFGWRRSAAANSLMPFKKKLGPATDARATNFVRATQAHSGLQCPELAQLRP
jgi:hypothetical protein